MALSAQEVKILITAQNQASAALKAVEGDLGRLGNLGSSIAAKLAPIGAALASIAVAGGAALAAGLTVGIKSAGDLEQAVANISTIKPDIDTSAVFAALNEMSTRIPQSAAQLGAGLYDVFSSMDVTQAEALSLMETFSKGATGAQTDAATYGTAVMGVMNAYKLSVKDAGDVSDWFFDIVNKGVVTGPELAASLGPVIQAAKAAGVEWRDLGPLIAASTKEGGPAAQNINNLNNLLQKFTTKEAQKELENLGIKTKTATGDLRSPLEVLTDLKKRTEGMTEAARANVLQAIFPDAQARMGAEVIMSQIDMVKQGTEEAQKSSGSAEAAYTKMSQTFNSQSTLLMNGLKAIGTTIGGELLPHITPLIKQFSEALPGAFATANARGTDAFRQLTDAWRTVQQAFAGQWEPSEKIEPLAQAAGRAALKVNEAAGKVGEFIALLAGVNVSGAATGFDKLSLSIRSIGTSAQTASSGGMKDFVAIVSNLGEILSTANGMFQGPIGWLMQWGQGANAAARETSPLTNALLALLRAGNSFTTFVAAVVEGFALIASGAVKTQSGLLSMALGVAAIWRGDTEAAKRHAADARANFDSMETDLSTYWANTLKRSTDNGIKMKGVTNEMYDTLQSLTREQLAGMLRTGQVYYDQQGQLTVAGMDQMAQAVSAGTQEQIARLLAGGSEAAAAVEAGQAAQVVAVEAGMAQSLTAIEANAPLVVAATDAMGTGMSGALEAAAPAMAAAAEGGAAGAVAAVEGQTGAASSAGMSIGSAIAAGLEGGILGSLGRVAAAAIRMVQAALTAGNQAADAHSPSRKTEKLGKDMADGLEIGLTKSGVGAAMIRQIQDFIRAAGDYVPVGREIARVEREIRDIRDRAQTEALFRAEDMITVESELLRLKRAQTEEERRLLPIRQDLADAERAVREISSGSLGDRSALLENDTQRKQIRLQTLDLEKQLVGLDRDSKRAEGIQKQIDKLRDQDRLLGLDAERITTTNDLAATAERRRLLGLGEIMAAEERNIQAIGREITVLGAEAAVFAANEAIIKNATDNEIAYRMRLIAVFNAEGKPLQDRILAGLALVEQLEKEGKISKELADKLRDIAKEAGFSSEATRGLGAAAAVAAPQLDAAAKKAKEMAAQAAAVAKATKDAEEDVLGLAKALGKLPDWMTPKGSGSSTKSVLFGDSAGGGAAEQAVATLVQPVRMAGVSAASGSSGGGVRERQVIEFKVGGHTLGQMVAEGMDLELRRVGTLPGGITR